jgi:hypothetical protein
MHRRLVTAPIIDETSIEALWPPIGPLRQRNSPQPMRAIEGSPTTRGRNRDLATMCAAVKLNGGVSG